MNGRYLLDTNIIIALFADEGGVKDNLAVVPVCLILPEFLKVYDLLICRCTR